MERQYKKRGLCDSEVEESRKKHGANILAKKKSKSFFRTFLENLGDPIIRILLVALLINLLTVFKGGDVIETVGIGISVFLASFISTLSERGSEAAFKRLSEECGNSLFRVWRNGSLCEISVSDIVVGDVVMLGAGEQVPADSVIIAGSLRVDQSMISGESGEVEKQVGDKNDLTPSSESAIFKGCTVLSGECEAQVFAVGEETFLGRISDEVKLDTRESPLKIRLTRLAKQISIISYIAAILIGLAYLFKIFVMDSGFEYTVIIGKLGDPTYLFEHLLHALMLSLTVVVMAVPEGLPVMIAVVLSSNIRRMIRDKVLVRKPVGIEAAGSMNILFTDKTGTLTEGKMSVEEIILADGEEYTSLHTLKKSSASIYALYRLNALLNTSSAISNGKALGGNSTEKALCASLPTSDNSPPDCEVKEKIQFDSSIKYSAARISCGKDTVLIKGAPEKLLPFCTHAHIKNGATVPFSCLSKSLLATLRTKTSDGARVICIATSDTMPTKKGFGRLTLVCAVAISDKPRPEAKAATEELRAAGVQVVMITGDNCDTAKSIAKKCGIINSKQDLVLSGDELARLGDKQLKQLLPRLAVVARVLPTDKSRLVRVAQESGLVTGMTGDGINDAPALKCADIGFSMGSGTEVAKEAGDIIILDNNLSSIAKAVLYGRTIFKSIRKFITLQLTMNFCAVGISMIGPFIGFNSPVTVVQMLWINIIMDTLGGLAFAGEAPRKSYMRERPKRRDEPILNGYMINQITVSGTFTVCAYIFFLLSPKTRVLFRYSHDNIYLLTAFFALFIFTSVLHCFNCRTDRLKLFSGILKNRGFVLIIALVCAVQIAFIYLGGTVLRTAPLTADELKATLLFSLCVIPIEFIRKLLARLSKKKNGF